MLESYRNGHTALGLIVGISLAFNIVGFLSVGYDWVGLEKARPDTNTYAEQQCARQQAERARPSPAILRGEQTAGAEPQAEQTDPAEEKEPDYCDLAAQQSMADSTVGMEQAAWVALALSVVGVIMIWRTLYYTRETLKEANKATRAAKDTIKVTRNIGKAQTRAYLDIAKAEIIRDGRNLPQIYIRFVNTGVTPARNIVASYEIYPFTAEKQSKITETDKRLYDLGSQSDHVITDYIKIPMTLTGIDWHKSEDIITIVGSIKYKDVFREPHLVKFSFFSTAKNFAAGNRLSISPEGNSST